MKHVFVINPAAGKENSYETIKAALDALATPVDYEIYQTKGACDATRFIKEYCEGYSGQVRFYACGGDGTLNEAVNGIVGYPNASLGCYPCGSGNDFVKYYGGKECFFNIEELVNAKEEYIDLMRVGDRYAINATHFGLDSCVAQVMMNVRRKKIIGGRNAYTTGVVVALFKGMKTACKVWVDGELLNPKGRILLCTIANGQYVGGSYRCAPRSLDNDGLLEVCLVHCVSHFTFAKLAKIYSKGGHLDDPKFEKYLEYRRGKSIRIEAPEGFVYAFDGELISNPAFSVEVIPSAVRFAVPASAKPLPGEGHTPLVAPLDQPSVL